MNKQNKNILNIIKTNIMGLIILIILQLIPLFIANICISNLPKEMNININIKIFLLVFIMIIYLVIDIVYYMQVINRVKYFLNKTPIECIIEDFIVLSYGYSPRDSDGFMHRKYRVYPVVKINNELFFTYGNYCIAHHTQKLNSRHTDIGIFRKDMSEVKIGDKAYLYIKNKIDVNVEIDVDKNKFELNKQIEHFNNFNKNYDINIIKNLNFFEGIIDIEPMQ